MTRVIGLTGQTGAGKSAVREMLEKTGIACVDCDRVSREVTAANSPALKALCEVFSDEILTPEKALDRKKLGSIVFSSKEKLELLNKTIFPFIIDDIKRKIAECEDDVVLDAPTLFESGCDKLCDLTVAVVADREVRLERIISRDGISKKDAENRINSQLSEEFFRKNCDVIIENNGDLSSLEKAVEKLVEEWRTV